MKKFLFFTAIAMLTKVGFAQTQSIVIQKNALPDATASFGFTATPPAGSTVSGSFNLVDNGEGAEAVEVGASCAGNGYLGITDNGNNVFLYTSGAANWTQPAGNSAVRMDIETNGTNWQINSSNNIYRGGVAMGTATDVGVGSDDGVYIVGTDTKLYKWNGAGNSYTSLNGNPTGKRIDGGPSGTAWYIGMNDHVYEYNGTTSIDHGLSPDNLAFIDIGVGADGKAWAIANSPNSPGGGNYRLLFHWNGSSWALDPLAPIGTTMYNVTVGADNEPLISLSFSGARKHFLKRLSDGRWVVINALTSNNNNLIFYNQPAGYYTFQETPTVGYYLQDILIFGNASNSYNLGNGVSNLSLAANEHAYIQYTNVPGTKPDATSIGSACGSTFNEDFGTGTDHASVPQGQTFNAYQPAHDVNDGFYALTNTIANAKGTFYSWITGSTDHDHTGNTDGRMFLVNADFSAGVFYEKEYTNLMPGNSYNFSAWVANILLNSATFSTNPNVILRVVDPNTGAILLDLTTGDIPKSATNTLDWKKYGGSFITTSSNVKVYLINNKPGGDGNDLVLDDISFTATCPTISGTVFDDANGMTDGLVNGNGTNIGNTLYVVLTDQNTGNVVASTLLPADGTYSFSNIFSGNYVVQITTTPPAAIGSPQPVIPPLPNGWVNTGDSSGTNNLYNNGFINSGNFIVVNMGANAVSGVNFGLEQLPTANNVTVPTQANPGGSNKLTVPTLNGSDPEQGSFPGTGNADTVVINALPTNAILYYDFGTGPIALAYNDTIKNYNPALLTVDPQDGITSIVFTYKEIDAALQASNIATVTMPLNTFSISGNVFDDANGFTDQLVNGTPVNGLDIDAPVTGNQPLYAQLILSGGSGSIATAPVQSDGTFNFTGVGAGTYIITINQTPDGSSIGPALPYNWVFTGDHQGVPTTVGSDENPDGALVSIAVSTSNVTDIDFGIDNLPVADAKMADIQLNPGGTLQVAVPTLTGRDLEDGAYPGAGNKDTIVIQTIPTNGILYYDFEDGSGPVVISEGTTIPNYNPALLTLDPEDGSTLTVTFTYSEVDAANKQSAPALVTMPFGIVMPVTITSFTAKEENANVDLSWNSSLEINTGYYIVERSIDNKPFVSIGKVSATGIGGSYQFTDAVPNAGVNAYRLKIIDKDGSVTYSKTVTATYGGSTISISSIRPNPFVSAITVQLNLQQAGAVSIGLIDVAGQTIYRKTFTTIKGINLLNVDGLDKLARGVYIINIDSGNNSTQQKVIKL